MDHYGAIANAIMVGVIIFAWAVIVDHSRETALTNTPSYSTGLVINLRSK